MVSYLSSREGTKTPSDGVGFVVGSWNFLFTWLWMKVRRRQHGKRIKSEFGTAWVEKMGLMK